MTHPDATPTPNLIINLPNQEPAYASFEGCEDKAGAIKFFYEGKVVAQLTPEGTCEVFDVEKTKLVVHELTCELNSTYQFLRELK